MQIRGEFRDAYNLVWQFVERASDEEKRKEFNKGLVKLAKMESALLKLALGSK